jgi:hypothetical protein
LRGTTDTREEKKKNKYAEGLKGVRQSKEGMSWSSICKNKNSDLTIRDILK